MPGNQAQDGIRNLIGESTVTIRRYLAVRTALLKLELADAARTASRKALLLALGAFSALCAYLLLWAGLIGLAEKFSAGSWPVAALAAAAFHLVVALAMVLAARRRGTPFLEDTINQFKEDEAWLKSLADTPKKP